MKIIKNLLVVVASLFILTACGGTKTTPSESSVSESSVKTNKKVAAEKRIFIDSVGREVEVPKNITKIAPSGPLAQIVLYTSSPDLLVGLATPFSKEAQAYIDKKYQELPEFGQFYGKKASLNMEALSVAAPDVIIDIGEPKKTVKEDMDKLQSQIDIPTIFIEANLENLPETYKKLGELLGNTKETEKLGAYCKKVLDQAEENKSKLSESKKKTIYYASGNVGLNTNAEGSFHAQVIDAIGVKNAVTGVDITSQGGGTVVSMEQLIQWQPDYILADSEKVYQIIQTDASWKELTAVKEKHVYKVPTAPYNFMGFPPSVNRIIGIQWLGNLVYPEQYELTIDETVKEFYDLFYHVQPSEKQIAEILANAK
ncbi:ABC transporter substrate-binding protein [Enterococcus rivorum]|uniref:ABC transporter substrate-binding protein n=1 Tax=Enterococcus rivorum TaxID=762845 RepID=A0A1E5KTJ5_9ENTE|nr:ABC transporter substrate-binding protein [Enterococcus rivorum]MBP2097940.1 iron complex transport system substrate-binding protein [Enterococcus rivorum]OEH81207.1 ABC transporter substrate-binding protein [Enterococcus rivorum]